MSGIRSLERVFNDIRKEDPRNAAEFAYALAVLYQESGNFDEARRFKGETLDLLNLQCDTSTLSACAAKHMSLGGVSLPSLFHQGTVISRLTEKGIY